MEKKTNVEKAAGNRAVQVGATTISALSSLPIAALLPTLVGTLASTRFSKRVTSAILDLEEHVKQLRFDLDQLTDAQFKFLNETVSAILHTVDQEKLDYLRTAAKNSFGMKDMEEYDSVILSRILRDISARELAYLVSVKDKDEIVVHAPEIKLEAMAKRRTSKSADRPTKTITPNKRVVSQGGIEFALLSGLANLGLIAVGASGWGGTINYRVLPTAHKIVELVKNDN